MQHDKNNLRHEQGSSIIIALIVLIILSALGYMVVDVADTNLLIAANDRMAKHAFFTADTGINRVTAILQSDQGDEIMGLSGNLTCADTNKTDWLALVNMNTSVAITRALVNPCGAAAGESTGPSAEGKHCDFILLSCYEDNRSTRARIDQRTRKYYH
jgi:Tfp pilus assembly protein PilX